MADLVGSFKIADGGGGVSGEMHRWMKDQRRRSDALGSGKAAATQTMFSSWLIEYPENKNYMVIVNSPIAFTIDSVTTKCTTGTCFVTVFINGTDLGGTYNSVSTSEQTQAHGADNEVAVGDDVTIVVTSNASAENVSVTLSCTVALAT